ncbi:hypothetical protein VTI74DRAFT_935 [Chaetomium olivicolor]
MNSTATLAKSRTSSVMLKVGPVEPVGIGAPEDIVIVVVTLLVMDAGWVWDGREREMVVAKLPDVMLVEKPVAVGMKRGPSRVKVVCGATTMVIVVKRTPSMIAALATSGDTAAAASWRVVRPSKVTRALEAEQERAASLRRATTSEAESGIEKLDEACSMRRGMASPMVTLSEPAREMVVQPFCSTEMQSVPVKPLLQMQEQTPWLTTLVPPLAHLSCCWQY